MLVYVSQNCRSATFLFHAAVFISSLHFLSILSCVYLVCIVRVLMWVGAFVCVFVYIYALRIVSRDKILHFTNTLIIIVCALQNTLIIINYAFSSCGMSWCGTTFFGASLQNDSPCWVPWDAGSIITETKQSCSASRTSGKKPIPDTHTHMHTHTHACTHMHAHTHKHTRTRTHTHT